MTRSIKTAVLCVVASAVACGVDKDPVASGSGTPDADSGSADDDDDDDDDGPDDSATDPSATTDAGETTVVDDDDSEGEGESFILNPDGGGEAHQCDLWVQDCPRGEKCMPYASDGGGAWNATKCVELEANAGQPGDPCTVQGSGISGLDDCDATSMCWDIDPDTNIGTCQSFCAGSEANPVCADPETTCVINNGGAIILCLPTCDPLLNECPPGNNCYPTPTADAFTCVFDANGTDDGAYGDACMFANVCNMGLHCADASAVPDCGTPACCTSYCDTSDPEASAACPGAAGGQECIPWFPENAAPPGLEDLGACQIPT